MMGRKWLVCVRTPTKDDDDELLDDDDEWRDDLELALAVVHPAVDSTEAEEPLTFVVPLDDLWLVRV